MNHCPCGYYGDPRRACTCAVGAVIASRSGSVDRLDVPGIPTSSCRIGAPTSSRTRGKVEGQNEATLNIRLGNVLVQVTAVVPNGAAEYVARTEANAIAANG
jgi:hypothetical protein